MHRLFPTLFDDTPLAQPGLPVVALMPRGLFQPQRILHQLHNLYTTSSLDYSSYYTTDFDLSSTTDLPTDTSRNSETNATARMEAHLNKTLNKYLAPDYSRGSIILAGSACTTTSSTSA